MQQTLYLIDGYSFLYRAFYVVPPLNNPSGVPIAAVYGFTKMLLKLIETHKPDFAVVAYDNHLPTLRKQLYPAYKANRSKNEELTPQFPYARDASRALGFINIEAVGYEADDIIATLTRKAEAIGMKVVIVSADKDLMQLVNENVSMYDSMRDKWIRPEDVAEKFGVQPELVADYLALIGDVSDNIPGVPRIGSKTASRLLNEYGNLDGVLMMAGEVTQKATRQALLENQDQARLSRQLVELYYDVPVFVEIPDMGLKFNKACAQDFYAIHGFTSLIDQ